MQKNRNKQGVHPARFLRQLMALMLIMLLGGSAWAQTYYVFRNTAAGNYFMTANNSGLARNAGFNPATCLWVLNGTTLSNTINGTTYTLGYDRSGAGTNGDRYQFTWKINGRYTAPITINGTTASSTVNNRSNGNGNNITAYVRYANNAFGFAATASNYAIAQTVTINNVTGGTEDFTIAGTSFITSTGNYDFSHTNKVVTPTHTHYAISNGDNYYDVGGNITTTDPRTESTTGYVWSLTGGGSYASINSTSGRLTVTSMPSDDVDMTVTCTLNGVEQQSMTVTLSNITSAGYVIYDGNNHYLGGTNTTAINGFNPNTCLWTGTSGGKWQNSAGYYIAIPQNSFSLTNNNGNATNTYTYGTESGTTGQKVYAITYGTNYFRAIQYNNGWQRTDPYVRNTADLSNTGTQVLFSVRKKTGAESSTAPTVSGDATIATLGNNSSYTHTDAAYTMGYNDYIFYNGAHHYWKSDDSEAIAGNTKPTAESFTYTWSLSGNAAGHATVNASTGVITYSTYYDDDTDVTLTLTATSANKTFTVNKTIQFQSPKNDPTGVSASDMTLNAGEQKTIVPTLTPDPCYKRVEFSSANTSIATVNATTGEVTGVAGGQTTVTIKAFKYSTPSQYVSTTINVTVMEKVATPVIEFAPQGEGDTASTTITCGTAGASIYYTTDGTEPTTSSTLYNGTFTVNNLDVVKAIAVKDGTYFTDSEVASATYSKHKMPTPTITIDGSGVSFTCPEDGASFYYTIDGSNPTTGSTLWNGTPFTPSANECTIKVIAVKAGSQNSDVAERPYVRASGVSGDTVYLNDFEDHTWTYYAGVNPEVDGGHYNTSYRASGTGTRRNVRLYSPNPRNLKITYNGVNGIAGSTIEVKVSAKTGEGQNSFVYYTTLEEGATAGQYPYQVISNPFSVRPSTGTGNGKVYYGFNGWEIVSGGKFIRGYNDGQTLPLDAEIVFENLDQDVAYTPNCTSAEIVFQTTWTQANVQRGGGNVSNAAFNGGNYEKNFCIINADYGNALAPTYPVTITSVEPDGSATYNVTFSNLVTPASGATNMTKLEYMNWNPSNTVNPQGRNLTIGRGVTMGGTTRALVGTGTAAAMNQVLKVESGTFTTFTSYTATPTSRTKHWVIFGCDYDRAKADNSKLTFSGKFLTATGRDLGYNSTGEMARVWSKSGSFMTGVSVSDAAADNSYYIGVTTTQNQGHRYLEIQGGEWYASIAGGMGDNHTATEPGFTFRMKGGKIRGSVYGAAAWSGAGGTRTYIITGGEINGWVAAGANGTQSDGGKNDGASYVYVGGNAVIDSKHSTTAINRSVGGNVYGAGCGYSATSSSGEMTLGSNMVVADNAYIERGIYGGGGFGFVTNTQTSYIYVTGGHVGGYTGNDYGGTRIQGGVYGGARQNKGGSAIIYMTGGLVETGIYGGSNNSGTMNGSVTMQINGGQVGTSTTPGNIHGGGYGQNTIVSRNVDITLGKTDAARDADGVTVWGDVYGGSALGKVNGEAATNTYHTNVTMNAGYIHGSLYGGALGSNTVAANVYGPVQVKVYGGSVFNTDGTGANGSGAVYGANNINGAPQRSVTVDIYGTNSAPAEGEYALFSVYGGGNAADYTYGNGYPKVTVHNCDNSIKYVYGGGNAAAVAATDVTIYGGNKIGNVFGGGNGQVRAADVNGNTNVKIYGGTIGDVYGGSNTKGTIGGTISVNVNAQAEPSKTACPINIDNVYGGGNKATSAAGNITIGCAEHIGAVYGGANQANITGDINLNIVSGHIDNVFGGNNTSGNISGTITVTVNDTNFACGMEVGNVYGGGNKAAYGTGTNYPVVNIKNGHLTGSVFGGGLGATAVVTGSPRVTIGQPSTGIVHIDGNVFGGGDAAEVVGKPTVLVQNCNTMIGTKNGAGEWNTTGGTVYGGGNAADITGGTTVTITGGSINRVFGGGNGEVSPANVTGNASTLIHGGLIHQAFAGSNTQGSISGTASITVDHDSTACGELIDELYGGGNLAAGNAGSVTIECGAIVGDVYGGANQAAVNSDITLNITGGTIARAFGGNNTSGAISGAITVNVNKDSGCDLSLGSVFGAGNQAPYTGNPVVNIKNGTVTNNVYGGGLGASAVVTGNPQVTIGDNSDPAWEATVGGDVYGGGDAAAVVGTPVVHVIAKTNTTIANVYGGGNAADVRGTNVTIDGGQITGMVFGGGHGDKNSEPQKEANVNGDVTLNVTGGTINKVFAGSNSKGNITGNVNFTINKGNTSNPMHITEVYGGGNEAAGNAGTITIGCTGGEDEGIGDVYGGANAADINSGIALNITGGKIGRVFGGNNTSGAISGGINVTVDWSGSCGTNSLGSVFGAGNQAPYTGSPVVYIKNGTINNNVFGGGLGATAVVTGNPQVTVGNATAANSDYVHIIGNVFGGGDAANVEGSPSVTVNNCNTLVGTKDGEGAWIATNGTVYGGGNAAHVTGGGHNTNVTINGGDIYRVFGGGNGEVSPANVAGDANTTIHGGNIHQAFAGSNTRGTITGTARISIDHTSTCPEKIDELYGGGNLAAGGAGEVNIGCDAVLDDVYGGANQADVSGDITLNITGGTIGRAFGGNNKSGVIDGAIEVNVIHDGSCALSLGYVYGAGNQAAYTTPGGKVGPTVNIKHGTVDHNVFGGGLGASAKVTGNPVVTIGDNTNPSYNAIVGGEVYGGGDAAPTDGNPTVNMGKGNVKTIYGGGKGADALVTGNPTVNVSGTADIDFYVFGGGDAARTAGSPTVNITGGVVGNRIGGLSTPSPAGSIYGGGKGSSANVDGNPVVNISNVADVKYNVFGGGSDAPTNGNTTVIMTSGTVEKNIFGGGEGATATTWNTTVKVSGASTKVGENVYGGGLGAEVNGETNVLIGADE